MQGSALRVFTLRQLLALFGQSRSLFLKGGETGLMQGVLDGLVPVPRGIDDRLVERGADTIAFASCIGEGTPIGYPCPFFQKMLEAIKKDLPENVRVFEYTH